MSIITSPDFFINQKSIPDKKSVEYDAFFSNELDKITYGITINDIYIHGWLYWHLNHWNIYKDIIDPRDGNTIRSFTKPDLRDNEWIIAEHVNMAEKQKKGLMIFGSRRLGKSEFEASWIGRAATIYEGSENVIGSTNEKDLVIITSKIDKGLSNLHPYFRHGRLKDNWVKEVSLGYKDKKGVRYEFSKIAIRNLDGGKATEAFAGLTPKTLVIDEVGKDDWAEAFAAAIPAFTSPFGWRCSPILTGCVCAGTKVWNNKGELVNIENLNKEDGILGFDISNQELSKEDITYWQPPFIKKCYKITTKLGRTLECSEDHPILFRSRKETYGDKKRRGIRKIYFKETKDLKAGDQIAIIDSVPIFGTKEMWEPRFIGMLIGDGSYGFDKTPVLSNCDKEINDYIDQRFDVKVEKSCITKDGRFYRENRIKGICSKLREIGIYGQTKSKKTLPLEINNYTKESISEFLGGLFDTDGCVHVGKINKIIKLTASHKNILEEVKYLLLKFGIHSSISYKKPNFKNPKDKNGWYDLLISDRKSLLNFKDNIKLLIEYKNMNLERIASDLINKKNQIPKEVNNLRFEVVKNIEFLGECPVYNLTAGNTNTYLANGIVTHNTGGTLRNDSDAEKFFKSPESRNFLALDYPNKKGKYGLFIDGLKRMEGKVETTFGNYLKTEKGILIPEDSELYNLKFWNTDINKSKAKIQEELEQALQDHDPKAYLKQRMYFPEDPDDCFLTDDGNDFPIDALREHLNYLELSESKEQSVVLYRTPDGTVSTKAAPDYLKPVADFPVQKGTIKDAPIVIFEEPIANPPYGLYISGADPYNQSQSKNSESLGSIYIYKRLYDAAGGTFQDSIVASYTARPSTMKEWHENAEMLLEYYNAVCMPENEGGTFIQYFDQKNKAHMLADGVSFLKTIAPSSSIEGRIKGLPATVAVQRFWMNLIKEYLKELIQVGEDENKAPIFKMGLIRILDKALLKEFIAYKSDKGNYDRIYAFGHALACNVYFNKLYPNVKLESEEKEKPFVPSPRSPFILKSSSPFSRRKSPF